MIPVEAVEAAAKAEWARYGSAHPHATWETDSEEYKEHLRFGVTQILEAAAPHMREDKRGDGDYRPGWDDRKTLSSLWQEHAPLPNEGLSERVYEALIAVATWGYQQRKDEEL